jgi:hypothetical protein
MMKTVGTFMDADWLVQAGPDAILDPLKQQLGLNLVIFSYPKPLWFPQIVGEPLAATAQDAVAPLREAMARTQAKGIRSWLYVGTFGERDSKLRPEFNVRDIDGGFVRPENPFSDGWASGYSFCPNNPTLKERYAAVFREMARAYEPDGFFIGHNRFSPLGHEFNNLFSCACPHCRRSAGELGYDFAAMRQAVSGFRDTLQHLDARKLAEFRRLEPGLFDFFDLLGSTSGLVDWINFRCDLIARMMNGFRAAVKEARKEAIFGQDSLPPSFSLLSGHNYRQLEDAQDYLCPNVSHVILFVIYSLAETARHLCDWNPDLSEGDVLSLVYRLFGYDQFHLPATVSELVGNLPGFPMPKDTSATEIPLQQIVAMELRKAKAYATGKVPLYTLIAFGKLDLTPEGVRERISAVKEAGYDGCILNANWTVGLDKLQPRIDAIRDLMKD